MIRRLSLSAGLLIPVWLLIGVWVAGSRYPAYSHLNQAMSELGAVGAATHELSPIINNFPLGILFIVFGLAIIHRLKPSKLAIFSGVLVIIHGLGSIAAGYFSCDLGCKSESPSTSQIIHNLSGLAMLLTLTIANASWIYLGKSLLRSSAFSWFSLICLVGSLSAFLLFPSVTETGQGLGLMQRINYGVSTIWLGGLSLMLLRRHFSNEAQST